MNSTNFVNSNAFAGLNSIAAALASKGIALPSIDGNGDLQEVTVDPSANLVDSLRDLLGAEAVPMKGIRSRKPEWIEVADPTGCIWNVPIFNKTATNSVDGATGLTTREIKLPPYVKALEKGNFRGALVSIYREMVFQLRNELGLRVQGFFAPVAVSAEIPEGFYKFLYDSKGRVSRILVNEAQMETQAVDSDGDRAFVLFSPKGHGTRVVFCKIPFTSQAPILERFEGAVFEDWASIELEDLPGRYPASVLPYNNIVESAETLTETNGVVQSVYDQFIKNHTPAPVGISTTEWNAAEAQYFLENDYNEAVKLAFMTEVEMVINKETGETKIVKGRFQDIEKNGLKLSRKDGSAKVEMCYEQLNYQSFSGVAKNLLSSASGIQKLVPGQLQHLRYASVDDLVNRYWNLQTLTNEKDDWGQRDLKPRAISLTKKAEAFVTEQKSLEKAIELAQTMVKMNESYGWNFLAELYLLADNTAMAEKLQFKAKLIDRANRETGWGAQGCFRDGGLITRLVKAKLLRVKAISTHRTGLPIYQVELFDLQGNAVALFDQKREGNDLPDKGIGYHYLLPPVYDAEAGRWMDGLTAMRFAFRQESRFVTEVDPETREERVIEEVRSFDRYFFAVRNPETMEILCGFGCRRKDWLNKRVMNELQEAITAYCGKVGILVNSNYDRSGVNAHNLKSAECTVAINYGRYVQSPEDMWEIFAKARETHLLCPGNKQQNPLIRKYAMAKTNGVAVWAHPDAHMSRPGKNQAQINKGIQAVKARIALVDCSTKTGGWISTQGVAAQSDVQCFYPQVIQDPEAAAQYAEDNGKALEELETKMVHTWTGGTKQIWLTPAKDQIEVGKFIDAKFGLKYMPADLGGTVTTEDGEDVHFVIPVSEIVDKGALYAMLQHGLTEKVIEIVEKQGKAEQTTRVKALIIETTVYRSGSHSENTPAKYGASTIGGFDRFAVIQPLKEIGWEIPTPHLTNFLICQEVVNQVEEALANA